MGIIQKLQQVFAKKKQAIEQPHKTLTEWQTLYKDLQGHPLTQMKVINEELLHTTNKELQEVKTRLDKIEAEVFNRSTKQIESLETAEETIENVKEKIVVPYARLSRQEKRIVEFVKKCDHCNANKLAEKFGMSRSNASLKLNKLYSWNFLNKEVEDKRMIYSLNTRERKGLAKSSKQKSK